MKKLTLQSLLLTGCLVCFTGISTHALLMVHLHCCNDEKSAAHPQEQDEHPRPAHDHAHCLFCQSFLGIGGKYMSPPSGVCLFSDTAVIYSDLHTSNSYIQPVLTDASPRGPPC